MKALGMFVLSCVVHWTSFVLCLWLGLMLGTIGRASILLLLQLLLVAWFGFIKAAKWGPRWNAAFASGLLAAAVGALVVVVGLMYAFSYPVPDRLAPPPFWTYVVLRSKNAGVWMAVPFVAWSAASAMGYVLASSRARKRSVGAA